MLRCFVIPNDCGLLRDVSRKKCNRILCRIIDFRVSREKINTQALRRSGENCRVGGRNEQVQEITDFVIVFAQEIIDFVMGFVILLAQQVP